MVRDGADSRRSDPCRNFRFRVKIGGRPVAGDSRMSGLKRATEVVEQRGGVDPSEVRASPGRTEYDAVTLERGITNDARFDRWARRARWRARKDVVIELTNEVGQVVVAYRMLRVLVSEYRAVPELENDENAIAIQTMTLENEGWERITHGAEPIEPPFDDRGGS